jgi:hypothetical protein
MEGSPVSEVHRVVLVASVLPNEAHPIRCPGSGHVADASVHLNQVAQMPAEPSFPDPKPPATVQVVTSAEVASVDLGSFGEAAAAMDARYGLEVDYESISRLCEEHGLRFPM